MSDINRVILIGRLARQPELKYTKSGTAVVTFVLVSSKVFNVDGEKKEDVSFIKCSAWSKRGETICKYVQKGHRIAVEGRISQNSWQDSNGNKRSSLEVVVENFQFLQKSGGQSSGNAGEKEYRKDEHDYIPDFSSEDMFPVNEDIPKETKEEELKRFEDALRGADWNYEYSDDRKAYSRGKESVSLVRAFKSRIEAKYPEEVRALWNTYCPSAQ